MLDGLPTNWASGKGKPLPQWAEIVLPEPVEVSAVEVIAQKKPRLPLMDLGIEARVQGEWKLIKAVRNANAMAITGRLDTPVRTAAIRVTVRRQVDRAGVDRKYANLEAVRVLDTADRNVSTTFNKPIPVVAEAGELHKALAGRPLAFAPMAVRVKPNTAEILARYDNENRCPAIVRNRYGKGQAVLVTTSESTFDRNDPIWAVLGRLTVGEPTLKCDPDAADRYRIILTEVGGKHVLHVIDRSAAGNQRSRGNSHRGPKPIPEPFEARDLRLSLLSERLDGVNQARLIGSEQPLKLKQENGYVIFTVRPDPVASAVLE